MSTFPINQVKTSDGQIYAPQTTFDAVLGFGTGVGNYIKDNPVFVFNQISKLIQTWYGTLPIPKQIKLQSPDGTVFLLTVSNDGELTASKEIDDGTA